MGPRPRTARGVLPATVRSAALAALLAGLLAAAVSVPAARAQAVRYVSRLANINRVGMTISNYGFLGNRPGNDTLLGFLGPWPWRVGIMLALTIIGFTVLMLPWWHGRRQTA